MGTQKVLVGGSSVTASQMKDFWRQVEDGSIDRSYLQLFLDHRLERESRFNWPKVYQTLGMEFHPGELEVPEDPNHWDIYVMKGVTPNMVVAALRKQGVIVDTYVDDLDKGVSINDRDPKNGSYRVRFKANIEADPEYVNKSANDLKEEKIQGITLLERLLLELAYFLATKKHLDIENITLCSGSRYSGGCVPGVDWSADDRKLFVDWYGPQHRHSDLRARAVVS